MLRVGLLVSGSKLNHQLFCRLFILSEMGDILNLRLRLRIKRINHLSCLTEHVLLNSNNNKKFNNFWTKRSWSDGPCFGWSHRSYTTQDQRGVNRFVHTQQHNIIYIPTDIASRLHKTITTTSQGVNSMHIKWWRMAIKSNQIQTKSNQIISYQSINQSSKQASKQLVMATCWIMLTMLCLHFTPEFFTYNSPLKSIQIYA